jgi:hypothetical protein
MIQKCYNWKENKTLENKNSSKRIVVLMKYATFFFAQISLKRATQILCKRVAIWIKYALYFQHKFHPNKKVVVDEMYTFISTLISSKKVTIGRIKKTPTK